VSKNPSDRVFPKDFLWGAATSSHQVEGGCTNNNWYAFESASDASGRPRIAGGQKAGDACRHWEHFRGDIGLLKALGLNAYRFSVEWSKIEPREGCWDDAALQHYEEVVDALCEAGIVPMLTLHHFTNPLWFEQRGGFLQKDAPELLARFAKKVYGRLADRVPFWCTINEPSVYAVNGYVTGEFPPAERSFTDAGTVLVNMMRAHGRVYEECKALDPTPHIGLATNVFIYQPARPLHPLDNAAAWLADRNLNREIFRCLSCGEMDFHFPFMVRTRVRSLPRDAYDFLGINYYTRFRLRFSLRDVGHVQQVLDAPPERVTDMGWEIFPGGLAESLRMAAAWTAKPIYITENGLADDGDTKRAAFFRDHLRVLSETRKSGIDVRGYFCWSLMDNFEWAHGYSKRFGLYHVDFATQQRTLRKGSEALRDFIKDSTAV
jgi:beta-glucosidase